MSGEERKLVDAAGDYAYAVRSGDSVEPEWRSCRLVVTDRRLVIAGGDDRRTVPHARVELLDEASVPEGVDPGGATPVRIGESVLLIDAPDVSFEREYCRAALHGTVILARHPTVVGGVVREEADWSKARFAFEDDVVRLAFPDDRSARIEVADVGTVETDRRTVLGEERTVLAVEHTRGERSVETHLSGTERHTRALSSLFESVVQARDDDYELDELESQVLMALYSGVSPFEMAEFVGVGVDEVEEIYQRLLAVGAVDEVRTRTEVALNAQGRNMASEAMNEQ